MLKTFKTEINPTAGQKQIIHKTIGVCRFIYNLFLSVNKELHEKEKRFLNGYEFAKWINNDFIPNNIEYAWIKEVSSKSVKQSIMNAEKAFKNFFKRKTKFPRYKKKGKSNVKMYFVKNDAKTFIQCERHRINIPTLGWVQLNEKGYIPTNQIIKSGTVSMHAGRYYVSVIVDVADTEPEKITHTEGIGIDLGLKEFAVISDGTYINNINKTATVMKTEKKLKREERKLSRMYNSYEKRNENNKEGEEVTRKNIQKQVLVVQKLHQRLYNVRTDNINKIVNDLVKTKPSYIAIEDLNVSGMMKNRHLSKAVAQQKFYSFRIKIENKCKHNGIELRIVDRYYPSSKLCHACGRVKSDLKLSDRTYTCDCGYTADRDYNAAINLRDATNYKIS